MSRVEVVSGDTVTALSVMRYVQREAHLTHRELARRLGMPFVKQQKYWRDGEPVDVTFQVCWRWIKACGFRLVVERDEVDSYEPVPRTDDGGGADVLTGPRTRRAWGHRARVAPAGRRTAS